MSLHQKIAVLVAVLCLGVGAVAGLWAARLTEIELHDQINVRGRTIAGVLAEHSVDHIVEEDRAPLLADFRELTLKDKDLVYTYITDFDGEIFAHSFAGGFPVSLLSLADELGRSRGEVSRELQTSSGHVLHLSYPLIEGTRARLHVGFSAGAIDARVWSIQFQIIAIALGIALIGVLAGFFLSGRITGPLRRVSEVMTAYGRNESAGVGTLDTLRGGREVTVLAQSFRDMVRLRQEAESRLQGITDNLPGGVYQRVRHADGTATFPYISEGFKRIYQVDADQVKTHAQDFGRFVHPDDRDMVIGAVRESEKTLGTYDAEYRLIGADGEVTWCRSIAQPRRLDNGDTVWNGVAVDITAQKRAQAEVNELNERLERRVEERTSELRAAQEELVRKERLAALGQLTGTVSHELRNPLGALRAAVATIKKLTAGEQPMVTSTVAIIDRSITRCDNIIADLLDYSRGDCAALAPTALDSWLGEVLDEYPLPPWLEMSREIETGARAMVDRERLRRVLINLMDNACQAMAGAADREPAPGDHRLRVTARRAGEAVEISVADTGPGIAPEDREKVFEPLYSTKAFGVGLGLSIVKQIVGQHGGRRHLLYDFPAAPGRAVPRGRGGGRDWRMKGKQ
jgi:PAS domain S-box-containing protein